MVLQPDQQRVCTMLKDTITLLCKNGLKFEKKFCVEAVIGVTLDDKDMFHISMNQVITSSTSDREERDDINSNASEQSPTGNKFKQWEKRRIKTENENLDTSKVQVTSGSDEDEPKMNIEKNVYESADDVAYPMNQSKPDENPSSASNRTVEKNDIIFIKEEVDDNWSFSQPDPQHFTLPSAQPAESSTQHELLLSTSDQPLKTNSDNMKTVVINQSEVIQNMSAVTPVSEISQLNSKTDQSSVVFHGLRCPLCPKILVNSHGLRLHMDLHQGKYRYQCKVCQKGFMSSTTLKGHMTRHTGIKEYKCSICGKEFGHKYSYRKHMAVLHYQNAWNTP